MKKFLTRKEFAKLCSVSINVVNQACVDERLSKSLLKTGEIDPEHPDAVKFKNAYTASQRLINHTDFVLKKDFAVLANVSQSVVYMNCKKDLSEAVQGKYINTNHPAAREFIERYNPGVNPDHIDDELDVMHAIPDDIRKICDWPLIDICKQFGGDVRFLQWVRAQKEVELVQERRLKNLMTDGSLIRRDYVRTHIFGLIETTFTRLLSDTPKSLTNLVTEQVKSGASSEEIEISVREIISKQIRDLKTKSERLLKADGIINDVFPQ